MDVLLLYDVLLRNNIFCSNFKVILVSFCSKNEVCNDIVDNLIEQRYRLFNGQLFVAYGAYD